MNSKPAKEELEQLREILRYFNQILHRLPTWETPKTRSRTVMEPWGPMLMQPPVMHTRPAGTKAVKGPWSDKLVAEAVARESAWLTVTFTAILKVSNSVNMPISLKATSRAAGIKAMPPFDWTKRKAIYQRWQLWSEKARHALDCMEGDSVKAKISYSPHIESWKNNKKLISQEDYDKLDETQKGGKYSSGEI